MSTSVSIDLTRFDESYASAPSGDELYLADVPDGEYQTVVEDVRLTESMTSGNPMIVWILRIADPRFGDRTLRKNRAITDRTIPWVKEDLVRCGVELKRLSELPSHLDKMLGREVTVLKRTKDGRSSIYFLRVARPVQVADEEDVPF